MLPGHRPNYGSRLRAPMKVTPKGVDAAVIAAPPHQRGSGRIEMRAGNRRQHGNHGFPEGMEAPTPEQTAAAHDRYMLSHNDFY